MAYGNKSIIELLIEDFCHLFTCDSFDIFRQEDSQVRIDP
jgi:hypothetical protein